MTNEVVQRLRAALDEREQVAKAAARATGYGPERSLDWATNDDGDVIPSNVRGNDWIAVGPWNSSLGAVGAHIAASDPAHVLRTIEAHRQIVDAYEEQAQKASANSERYVRLMRSAADHPAELTGVKTHGWELGGRTQALEHVVELLAAIYLTDD